MRKDASMLAFIFSSILLCGCDHTPTISVNGSPNDIVIVQRNSRQLSPTCCSLSVAQGGGGFKCVDTAPILLDETGFGFHDRMGDHASYFGMSPATGCTGSVELPACSDATMDCVGGSGFFGFGTITINDGANGCRKVFFDDGSWMIVCNSSWVSLTLDGTTVSVSTSTQDNSSKIASRLATAIDSDPVLQTKVGAVASGNLIYVQSLQSGNTVDFVFSTTYPWSASCSYNTEYFGSCAFSADLAPADTMGTRPPL